MNYVDFNFKWLMDKISMHNKEEKLYMCTNSNSSSANTLFSCG